MLLEASRSIAATYIIQDDIDNKYFIKKSVLGLSQTTLLCILNMSNRVYLIKIKIIQVKKLLEAFKFCKDHAEVMIGWKKIKPGMTTYRVFQKNCVSRFVRQPVGTEEKELISWYLVLNHKFPFQCNFAISKKGKFMQYVSFYCQLSL